MRQRPLGQSGIEASVIAFGAWAIGGWAWGGTEEQASVNAVRAGLDAGINLIDTAPVYGFGRSEEIVAKAIEGRRDQVVLATKCGLRWDDDRGIFHFASDEEGINAEGDLRVHRYLAPDSIRTELEASLKRLKTDHIDLYQTHWQDPSTPIEDTMACLLKLKDEGKIRAIGVSNATAEEMDQYRAVGPIDADQERFSMLDRQMETSGQLDYCREHNIAVLAYSPLAHGLLTGKIDAARTFPKGDLRRDKERFSIENRERILKMLGELLPLAEDRGVTFSQLVLAWTLEQPGLTHALVGARSPEQAHENAAAGSLELEDHELAHIEEVVTQFV
ncbi:MAG: aldo/keto reductase [Phycisphaeraceae bacterium]